MPRTARDGLGREGVRVTPTPAPVGFHDARLTTPDPGTGVVERARLSTVVDEYVRHHPVTVVTGAGGSGKTYAVALWAKEAERAAEPLTIAWASLDRADRDPHRFWLTVVGSLQRVASVPDINDIAVPAVPNQVFVDTLSEALAHEAGTLVLVLDDVAKKYPAPGSK